jgi:alkylation response protein AidB-like acyl-CoA dehydrogenase
MTPTTAPTAGLMIDQVRALAPTIEDDAATIEEERRLTARVLEGLRAAGLFRMPMPTEWGGPELPPLDQVRVLEEVAYHDASTAWVAMICCDGGYYSGFLRDQAAARQLYPDLDLLTAGWLVPAGRAEVVPGGYRVSGRWSFGSGILHSERIVGGCTVWRDGQLDLDAHGRPRVIVAFLPADHVTIHDTWFTTGLRGTSSNDYSVDDVHVPATHTFSPFDLPTRMTPLYGYHGLFFAKVVAIPLGLLRRAIDELKDLAETKLAMPSMQPIRTEARVQVALAAAQADLDAAWGLVDRSLGGVWATLVADGRPTIDQRAAIGAMSIWVVQTVKAAIDSICEEAGTAAAFRGNRLERLRRDATTITHHVVGQRRTYQTVGQMLLGLEPDFAIF